MKRRHVFSYDIWGSVCTWPVEVDLSRNERSGTWTLYFRYVDPEARHLAIEKAVDASGVRAALIENNAPVLNFAESVEHVARPWPELAHLAILASDLRSLPRAETDGPAP